METILCKVTYNGIGMSRPLNVYFDKWEKAQNFLAEQDCGEVDVVTLEHSDRLNYSDGCTWNELTYGCEDEPKDITKYRRVYMDDGVNFRDESYEYYCHRLGINPDIHFVKITNAGTISFSCGKPDEVRYLLKMCRENGYKPSKKLVESAR